jgi:hypothetical protein
VLDPFNGNGTTGIAALLTAASTSASTAAANTSISRASGSRAAGNEGGGQWQTVRTSSKRWPIKHVRKNSIADDHV